MTSVRIHNLLSMEREREMWFDFHYKINKLINMENSEKDNAPVSLPPLDIVKRFSDYLKNKSSGVEPTKADICALSGICQRADNLPLPYAEAVHLVQYAEQATEDKLRIAYVGDKKLTKAEVLRIFTEELDANFEKYILPELAK